MNVFSTKGKSMAVAQRTIRWLLTLALTARVDLVAAQSTQPPCLAEYESTMAAAVNSTAGAEFTEKVRNALDRQRDLTRLVGSNCKESTSVLKDYGQQLEKAEKDYEPARKKLPDGVPMREKWRYPVAWVKYKICLMERFNQAVCAGGPSTDKDAGVKSDPTPTPGRAIVPAPKRAVAAANPSERSASPSSLSAVQISACSDEIKRVQIESQSWTGNADDVAARLGRFQKDLFEGRCSGHPEARAYINGANKMLAYGGNPSGSSGGTTATATAPLAPIRRDTQSKEHNPAHNASTCIKVYGPQEIKTRGLNTTANSLLVNTCPYAVSVMWCVEAGNGHAGDCGRGYSNTWDLSAAGKQGSMWGIPADGQMVQYAACRHGPNMGFQSVEEDPRHPYRFSCS